MGGNPPPDGPPMSQGIDLHVHTSASDGALAPAELVERASARGLEVLAITDHDTLAGVPEALAAAPAGLHVIPGVEFSADLAEGEAHLLGYYVHIEDPDLAQALALFREARIERAKKILKRLASVGIRIDWESLAGTARTHSIGRPHIAAAIVSAGYAESASEAIVRYLARGAPAYVPRHRLTPEGAIDLILRADGVAVLAHPLDLLDLVPCLVRNRLDGLEAYYPGYSESVSAQLETIAGRHGLVVTGGTDYHGPDLTPGVDLGSVRVPGGVPEKLRERWRRSTTAG